MRRGKPKEVSQHTYCHTGGVEEVGFKPRRLALGSLLPGMLVSPVQAPELPDASILLWAHEPSGTALSSTVKDSGQTRARFTRCRRPQGGGQQAQVFPAPQTEEVSLVWVPLGARGLVPQQRGSLSSLFSLLMGQL